MAILWLRRTLPTAPNASCSSSAEVAAARNFYTIQIYLKPIDDRAAETDYDRKYQEVAEQAAKGSKIVERVSEFVSRFNLSKKPVLEIGSGRGAPGGHCGK